MIAMTSSSIKVKTIAMRPGFLNCCNIRPDSAPAEKSRKSFLTKDRYFCLNQTNMDLVPVWRIQQVSPATEEIMMDTDGLDL